MMRLWRRWTSVCNGRALDDAVLQTVFSTARDRQPGIFGAGREKAGNRSRLPSNVWVDGHPSQDIGAIDVLTINQASWFALNGV